mgnify:CR=1 FL=1
MSFLGGGSSGGGQTTAQSVQPYSAAEPALGQILSEATNLYGQGVGAAGYVAPTQQTLAGLAGQETMANAAQQQLAATLGGQYLNPFLSPLIQRTAADISTQVAQQFSGAGRTPTSPMAQQQALTGGDVRQLGTLGALNQAQAQAQADAQREAARQAAFLPQQNLDRFAGQVTGLMGGYPGQTTQTIVPNPTPLQTALGVGTTLAGIYGGLSTGKPGFFNMASRGAGSP